MLAWYRQLAALRCEHPELKTPISEVWFDEAEGWLLIERPTMLVGVNLTTGTRVIEVGAAEILLASSAEATVVGERLTLPPNAVAILAR